MLAQVDGKKEPMCTAADHFKSGNQNNKGSSSDSVGDSVANFEGQDEATQKNGYPADKLKGSDGLFNKNAKSADKFQGNLGGSGKSADKFEGANTKGNGKSADKFEHTAEGGCKLVQSADGQSLVQADPTCTAADHFKSGNPNNSGKKSADWAASADGPTHGTSADKFANATGNRNGRSADGF
jgi:hypothetical protein